MTNTRLPHLLTALALVCFLEPAATEASSLSLDPTRVELANGEAQAITLRNRSAFEILVQARVLAWSQNERGEDLLEDSDDLVVSPPITRVPAHSEKVVRVALRSPLESEFEASYRLVLSEVLQETTAIGAPGVRFAIQFNIPVFANERKAPEPKLMWSIEDQEDGSWKLRASNIGNGHVQIRSLALRCKAAESDDQLIGTAIKPGYLLPGAKRSWFVTPTGVSCAVQNKKLDTPPIMLRAPNMSWSPDSTQAETIGSVHDSLDVVAESDAIQNIDFTVLRIHASTDRGSLEERVAVHIRKPVPVVADVTVR